MTPAHVLVQCYVRHSLLAALLAGFTVCSVSGQDVIELAPPDFEPLPVPARPADNMEHLTRGPLHEAFATSAPQEPLPGPIVAKQPPAEINELPSEFVPDDESMGPGKQVWIPGYWAWDDEREDFLWISGTWRVVPEGRHWIPGYWHEVERGWQWVSGFWAAAEANELHYVEQPPATLESGPTSPAPSDDHFWIPGIWALHNHAFAWQPGRWCAYRPDHVWVPDHYAYTPSGCVFVRGYWDHPLPSRGVLFAPVVFHQPVVVYRPSCRLNTRHLFLHLFITTRRPNYLFGDYYDVTYRGRGCYPLYDYRLARRYYNPLFSFYRVHYARRGIDCYASLKRWHAYYQRHHEHRPPRTLARQEKATRHKKLDREFAAAMLASVDEPDQPPVRLGRSSARAIVDLELNNRKQAEARQQLDQYVHSRRQRIRAESKIGSSIPGKPSTKPQLRTVATTPDKSLRERDRPDPRLKLGRPTTPARSQPNQPLLKSPRTAVATSVEPKLRERPRRDPRLRTGRPTTSLRTQEDQPDPNSPRPVVATSVDTQSPARLKPDPRLRSGRPATAASARARARERKPLYESVPRQIADKANTKKVRRPVTPVSGPNGRTSRKSKPQTFHRPQSGPPSAAPTSAPTLPRAKALAPPVRRPVPVTRRPNPVVRIPAPAGQAAAEKSSSPRQPRAAAPVFRRPANRAPVVAPAPRTAAPRRLQRSTTPSSSNPKKKRKKK